MLLHKGIRYVLFPSHDFMLGVCNGTELHAVSRVKKLIPYTSHCFVLGYISLPWRTSWELT